MKEGETINRRQIKQLNVDFPDDGKKEIRKKWPVDWKQRQHEQDQIMALMYKPAVDALTNKDGSIRQGTVSYYRGKINKEKGSDVRVLELLSLAWVGFNFDPVYLGLTKKAPHRWIPTVVGNNRPEDSLTVPLDLMTTVKVNYKQGVHSQCLLKGLASALHYVGLKDGGSFISMKAPTFDGMDGEKCLKELMQLMQKGGKPIGRCEIYNKKNGKNCMIRLSTIDLLNKLTIYPTVLVLVGNDGSVNHAVTVVDDLIFDSTQEFALKLTMESLNWICGPLGMKDIGKTYRFKRSYGTKEKLQHTLCRHW